MMRASIRELRNATKSIVSTISHGGTVMLTYHGKDCAKIIPISKSGGHKQDKEDAFGMWKDNPKVASVKKFIDEIRGDRDL